MDEDEFKKRRREAATDFFHIEQDIDDARGSLYDLYSYVADLEGVAMEFYEIQRATDNGKVS